MQNIVRKIFIVGIVGLIFIPFLFAHRQEDRVAEDENRYYANFPVLIKDSVINKEYAAEFDAWISDNARFRTVMKKIKVQFLYELFGKLELEDVAIGKNEELYGVTEEIIDAVQGRNLFNQEELEQYETRIYELQKWLESKEIDFYFMNAYDKFSIYPENFPEGIVQYGDDFLGKQTERYILENGRVSIVPIYDLLCQTAQNEIIYYQYVDWCHWNDVGMLLGYDKLMQVIQEKRTDIDYITLSDVEQIQLLDKRKVYGYEYPLVEQSVCYDIKDKNAIEVEIDDKDKYSYKEHSHCFYNKDGKYRALILNDSFIRMTMKNYLAESFEETLSLDIHNIEKIDEIVEVFQPDILILETYEMNIPYLYSELGNLEVIKNING